MHKILRAQLPNSTDEQRSILAQEIVRNNIHLPDLFILLKDEYKVATRFAWLLSNIGLFNKNFLKEHLIQLFHIREEINSFNFNESIIKYWKICGIPDELEGPALQFLFNTLTSPKTNVSIRTHALVLLHKLSKKYPDIQHELIICTEGQLEMSSSSFEKKGKQILQELKAKRYR